MRQSQVMVPDDEHNIVFDVPSFDLRTMIRNNTYLRKMMNNFDPLAPNVWKATRYESGTPKTMKAYLTLHSSALQDVSTLSTHHNGKRIKSRSVAKISEHKETKVQAVKLTLSPNLVENACNVFKQFSSLEVATYTQMLASVYMGDEPYFVYKKFGDIMNDIKRFTKLPNSKSKVFDLISKLSPGKSELKTVLVTQIECKDKTLRMMNVLDILKDSTLALVVRPEVIGTITDAYQFQMYL